jgi:cation:H+ antiporter
MELIVMVDWTTTISQLVILVISLAILIKCSDLVADSSANIAKITGLGEMAIGFLILSIITSLPELSVSISAVYSGDVGITIGQLFGSNIANIGLILGLTLILAPTVKVACEEYKNLAIMLIIASIVPLLILVLGRLTAIIGWILLMIFVTFSFYSLKNKISTGEKSDTRQKGRKWVKEVIIVLGGVTLIILSSGFVVSSSVNLSNLFKIDQAVIGSTVIAVGTSLPELSVSIASIKKRHMGLALGNILGSCITNLTLILGLVLTLSQVEVNLAVFINLAIMLIILNLTLWRFLVDNKVTTGDGLILLLLYIVFIISTLGIQVAILSPEYLGSVLSIALTASLQRLPYMFVGLIALFLGWYLGRG